MAAEITPAELFRLIDTDGNGSLNVAELKAALDAGGLAYGLSTVQSLMRLFSGGQLSDTSLNLAQFTALHFWLTDILRRFTAADASRRGVLSRQEARAALAGLLQSECQRQHSNAAHFALDEDAHAAFFDAADPDQNGTLDASEFVAAAATLKASFTVFRSFLQFDGDSAAAREGKITLDFPAFVYALAHIA
jgi:Ca2+-binding EF-hand superfamily protein